MTTDEDGALLHAKQTGAGGERRLELPAIKAATIIHDLEADPAVWPSDELDPTWDFNAAVQVAKLALWLGYEAAQGGQLPMWLEGEEFYAKTAAVRGR